MLTECHAHFYMNGTDFPAAKALHCKGPDENWVRCTLMEYQDSGIDFVRDGGDPFGVCELAKKLGPVYGIKVITPVFAIHKKGYYGGIVGKGFETMSEYISLVKDAKKRGADFIKIMTTGIMDFQTPTGLKGDSLPAEIVKEMVHIAHEEGMCVMSHTNGAEACRIAAEAGVDSLEHGNFQNEESIRALAENKTIWVPTVVTVKNLIGCGRFSDTVLKKIWEGILINMHHARRYGVVLAPGSDAGAFMVPHAKGLMDEYQAFREIFPDEPDICTFFAEGAKCIRTLFGRNSCGT